MPTDFEAVLERRSLDQARSALGSYGVIRPIVTAEWAHGRAVAVGREILIGDWRLFTDFLIKAVIPRFLGDEWLQAELRKADTVRHPILKWWLALASPNDVRRVGDNAERRAGAGAASLIRLAWDLYVLAHHSSMPPRILKRLRQPQQFQGARYEIWAAATCVRAGCTLAYEDESDGSRRHPEFVATHVTTGQSIDVEAKSRPRPGTKGLGGARASAVDGGALGIGRLFTKACAKDFRHPAAIFIDANLPGSDGIHARGLEIFSDLDKRGAAPQNWNLVVLTNHPEEYDETVPDPAPSEVICMSASAPRTAVQSPTVLEAIVYAAGLRGVPTYWDTTW